MKTPIRTLSKLFIPAITIIVLGLCSGTAKAATDIWTGGGGEDVFWHTANNWGGTAPVQGDFLIFTNTSSLVTSNNYPTATYFAGITFATPAGAFVLEGRSVATTNVADMQAITPQTIDLSLLASNNITIDMADNSVLNVNGEVLSPVGTTSGMTVIGNGTVNLNYDATNQTTNVFTGTLEVDGGTIVPASDLSLGTTNDLTSPKVGRLVLNSSTLEATGGHMTNINVNRGIAVGPSSGSGWGGLNVDFKQTLTYSGVIANNGSGTGGLSKSGFGTLILSGQNSYTGTTTNSVGYLNLDFSQPTAPSSDIINSSSALVMGGGNSGLTASNLTELSVIGSSGNSQSFANTHFDLGASIIWPTNASGSGVTVNLGNMSHKSGGVVDFIPNVSGTTANINTTAALDNGILGGWALISGDAGGPTVPDSGVTAGTNFATVDISGNIVNFTGYSNVTAVAGTMASQLAGSPQPPNVSIDDTAGATVVNVDTDNAGTTNDINAIKWTVSSGGYDGISIGISNTLRLGQYGGIIRNGGTSTTCIIGGTNSVIQSGNGFLGNGNIGILTAGGADNTAGEIVIAANNATESSGTIIFECQIADNGTAPVSVVKVGPGSIKLDGGNTFSGGLYLLQGRVQTEAAEISNTNSDGTLRNGAGAGDIYIFPGTYFLGDTQYTNHFFVAGIGDAKENFGVFRGATVNGPITLMGDTVLACDTTHINGTISGSFGLQFGAPGRNGTTTLASPDDSWTGDTIMQAYNHSGTQLDYLIDSNNEVIPNGFGYGNVIMEPGGTRSTSYFIWNLNGFNETVNGFSSSGDHEEDCIVTNGAAVGINSVLTIGDNDQGGSFDGIIKDGGNNSSGTISLTKIGAGVETFTRANTYVGATTISNGVLQLTGGGSINNSPVVNVEGGTFDVSGVSYTIPTTQSVNVNGGAFKIKTASSTGSGSLNLTNGTLELASASQVADYNGVLNLGGTTNIIRVDNFPKEGSWPVTFPLVTYTSLAGDLSTMGGEFPSTTYQGYFSNDLSSSTIYVVITNGPITVSVVWGGSVNGNWDNQTTPNFIFNSLPTNYFDGDIVTFPDVASQYDVHLLDDYSPGGLTVSNNVGHTYVFDGTGSLNGTNAMTKEGTGTWIIDNSAVDNGGVNGLIGGISILAGTLQVGNGDANGNLGPAQNAIGNNGSLVLDRSDTPTVPNTISGSGNIVVESGAATLSGANSFNGTVEVQSGATLVAGNNSALGSTNGSTTIDSGATLDVSGGGLGDGALNLGAEPVTVSGTGVGGNGAIVNSSATVGQLNALQQVTLAGDTTVGGASRWDIRGTGANLSTGGNAYNLTKIGLGFLGLAGVTVDPALADIDIQAGTLEVNGTTTGLGNPANTLTIESGATLQLYNMTNTIDKQIALNGDGITTTLTNASGDNIITGPMTLGGSGPVIVAVNTGSLALSNAISGSGSLAKNGTNTLVLTGPGKSYSGATTVNDGTLLINNSINSGSVLTENQTTTASTVPVVVGGNGTNGAAMDIEDTLWPGVSGKPATFGAGSGSDYVGTTGGGALVFNDQGTGTPKAVFSLNTATTAGGGVNDLVTVNGNFNGNFASVVINPLSPLTVGTAYTLVTYSGNKTTGFSTSGISVPAAAQPSRYTFSLDQGVTDPHKILLNVLTGAGNLVWNNNAGNGNWDVNTSINWTNTGAAANDVFKQLDVVTFDDSVLAGPTNTVTVATNVSPGSVKVDTTNNYVLTGTGKITGGTGLEKDGSGALIIGNTGNDFTGASAINAGTVVVNAANALGSGTVTVADGATLDVGGPAFGANAATIMGSQPIVVSGWGVNSNGAIINSSVSGQQNAIQNITLAGDTAFGGPGFAQMSGNPGRWDMRGGTPTLSTGGNAYNLYKVGSSQFSLVGVTVDTNLADIHVYGGEFGVETGTSGTLGNPTNTITMDTGTSLEMYNFAGPLDKNLIVNGGQMLDDSNRPNIWFSSGDYPSNIIVSAVTITNGLVAIGGTGSGTFSNTISGPGSLLICGGVTLMAADTYTGDTTVSNNGTLFLTNSASIDDSPNIILGGGAATLDAGGRTDSTLTLASGQTLSGSGTVNGSLDSPAGTTVSITTTSTNATVGEMAVTTNATLGGTINIGLDPANNTNDVLSVAGTLTYGGTLNVSTNSNFSLGANQSQTFKVFNATTYSGSFGSIQLPTIAGISWDTTQLAVNGTIKANSTLTPTPVITSISLSGTTLTFTATNGTASGAYALLESTNVALPLAQWTPMFTNNFDGSGNINLSTNVVDPSQPQTFYILQMQ